MKETLLQTALAKLAVNGQEITVRVLLDSGSQHSYIRKNIAESIGLQGPSEVLSLATLGGETSESKRFKGWDSLSHQSRDIQRKLLQWKHLPYPRFAIP